MLFNKVMLVICSVSGASQMEVVFCLPETCRVGAIFGRPEGTQVAVLNFKR